MSDLLTNLPPVVIAQLDEMRDRGWTIHQWAPKGDDPTEILAAVHTWEDGTADVVLLRSHLRGAAYRAMPCRDVFEPLAITYWELAVPVRLLAAVLKWDPAGQERRRPEPRRPLPSMVLPAAVRRQLTLMVDLPGGDAPLVAPPFHNTT